MSLKSINRVHSTYPLTHRILVRLNINPDFDYLQVHQSRFLISQLQEPPSPFSAGELSAIGVMGRVCLKLIDIYQDQYSLHIFDNLDETLHSRLELKTQNETIDSLLKFFPAPDTYPNQIAHESYFYSPGAIPAKRYALYKSLLLIIIADDNQALRQGDGFFTDPDFRSSPLYQSLRTIVEDFFSSQPVIDDTGSSLLDMLKTPAKIYPHSIQAQLEYIKQNWGSLLGRSFLNEILRSLDRLREEHKSSWAGPGNAENPLAHSFASYLSGTDSIRFSEDLAWMPKVILLAKNVFVWMDQLSKRYRQPIRRLDQIPDEELARLSQWGITGLWLIGIWQRSTASQKIKQLCGNLDAVPSAYSLYDYSIADILGGEPAYENLSNRARTYKIRLAADMVPNHMGIYSKWVIEHPDRFIGLDHPPFPSYSFNGPDLSIDNRVSIYLEDHYYDNSDAAVVFKRVDNHTGAIKYIYHGNDGTTMPWNDTAQLDFLQEPVRESIIQAVLHVARKFSIIRFDAAMTLAKKHYQRLWYPEPGSGGAIPTRSDFGLTKSEFNHQMPDEFWREVVDRVASEAPETLLLAEAFWMMEGYFVRTLGMHRVYNSAFMHMLRDEDNAKYRNLLIRTLEFDPKILKRYVNFMNNPDEETAIAQFGSDGKYFGVCVMMATLPGLPMFGHGQIEGYSEKYGMEYQRAYYDEQPNQSLIDRHYREVFPLLHKRYIFAEASHFVLYDFLSDDNTHIEDVFAYSNRAGDESALILYHNKWASAQGRIQHSSNINGKTIHLLDGLGLSSTGSDFVVFRDHISGLEYIRSTQDLKDYGLPISLGGYQYQVFLDFKTVTDHDGHYSQLNTTLQGRGVSNLQEKILEIKYSPALNAFTSLVSDWYTELPLKRQPSPAQEALDPIASTHQANFTQKWKTFSIELSRLVPDFKMVSPGIINLLYKRLEALRELLEYPKDELVIHSPLQSSLIIWGIFAELRGLIPLNIQSDLLHLLLTQPFFDRSPTLNQEHLLATSVDLLISISPQLQKIKPNPKDIVDFWFSNTETRKFLKIHDHNGISWFNQEAYEVLLEITLGVLYVSWRRSSEESVNHISKFITYLSSLKQLMVLAMEKSHFKEDQLIRILSHSSDTVLN